MSEHLKSDHRQLQSTKLSPEMLMSAWLDSAQRESLLTLKSPQSSLFQCSIGGEARLVESIPTFEHLQALRIVSPSNEN